MAAARKKKAAAPPPPPPPPAEAEQEDAEGTAEDAEKEERSMAELAAQKAMEAEERQWLEREQMEAMEGEEVGGDEIEMEQGELEPITELENREMEKALEGMSMGQLNKTAEAVGLFFVGSRGGRTKNRSGKARYMLKRKLLSADFARLTWAEIKRLKSAGEGSKRFLPHTRAKLQGLSKKLNLNSNKIKRLKAVAGFNERPKQWFDPYAFKRFQALRKLDTLEETKVVEFPTFNVRKKPDADRRRLIALKKVKKGVVMKGVVKGVSLTDGVRIDVGAEVDAVAPVNFQADPLLAKQISEEYPLGTKVKVNVVQVFAEGPEAEHRRFPLVVKVIAEDREFGGDGNSGGALFLSPASDINMLHGARKDGQPSPGALGVKWWAGTATQEDPAVAAGAMSDFAKDLRAAVEGLQPRSAPEKVLSLDQTGRLTTVEVPADFRGVADAPPTKTLRKAGDAWRRLVASELVLAGAELRCRTKLTADMELVEAELRSGEPPSVPVALLGCTLVDGVKGGADSKSVKCLLPWVEGDRLRFELKEFKSEAAFVQWKSEATSESETRWAAEDRSCRQADLERLSRLSACGDVRHARAVDRVESAELMRAGYCLPEHEYMEQTRLGKSTHSLWEEVRRCIEETDEIRDQGSLAQGLPGMKEPSEAPDLSQPTVSQQEMNKYTLGF